MKDPNVIVTEEQARLGATDPHRPRRVLPCRKTTWCYLAEEHPGDCAEEPRKPIAASDFGPSRKPRWSP